MKRKSLSLDPRQTRSEKIVHTYGVDLCFQTCKPADQSTINMECSVAAVESILMYTFNDKRLLEEALTHSSYTDARRTNAWSSSATLFSNSRSPVFSSKRTPMLTPVNSLSSVPLILAPRNLLGLRFTTGFISTSDTTKPLFSVIS
ncbi:hypothetical protein L1987_19825 [Smallanthus sonchifolius]|uniref:Uncharacterized protein n=1 Tax=Smallanthus sonchifolius TaxID=185202 RepID=A0ACB9IQJ8_9ASTR|nr:hypothetical protein L1987_19825 [Smallanthus sonchifolius]